MCPCIKDRIGIWKCWFLRRGKNQSTRRKTSQSKGENQQQTQPTYGVDARIPTRATLVGGECSHHGAILAPYMRSFPIFQPNSYIIIKIPGCNKSLNRFLQGEERKVCSSYVYINTVKMVNTSKLWILTQKQLRKNWLKITRHVHGHVSDNQITSREKLLWQFTWYAADSGLKRSLLFNLAQVNISEIINEKNAILPKSNFCCPSAKVTLHEVCNQWG